MNKVKVLESIKKLRESSKKRNFKQTFDLSINLKEINPKLQEQKVDLFIQLPHSNGRTPKIAALIDQELETKAKIFDKVVFKSEFPIISQDKKKLKQFASQYDIFLAQANLMGEIATNFGKVLGQKGKMPNPRAGAIVPPTADLEPIKQRFMKQVRLITKDQPTIKVAVGKEDFTDEVIADNVLAVYNAVLHALPREKENIKSVKLKLTMSQAVQVEY